MATPALWMLRWATGVRLYHLFAALARDRGRARRARASRSGGSASTPTAPSACSGSCSPLGAYLATATVLLGFSVVAVGRLLVGRVRRTLGLV